MALFRLWLEERTPLLMKILLGCEESDTVRSEFEKLGHDAWSCDLIPSRNPDNKKHIQGDVLSILDDGWDMAIFFTPCTYLCNSGVHWLYRRPERWELMKRDAELFRACMTAKITRIVNENPIPHRYALEIIGRKYDQTIQPWQFGHPESKRTCLWLQNVPKLIPTNVLSLPQSGHWDNQTKSGQNKLPPSKTRARDRATTYLGIAQAMAQQWGSLTQS